MTINSSQPYQRGRAKKELKLFKESGNHHHNTGTDSSSSTSRGCSYGEVVVVSRLDHDDHHHAGKSAASSGTTSGTCTTSISCTGTVNMTSAAANATSSSTSSTANVLDEEEDCCCCCSSSPSSNEADRAVDQSCYSSSAGGSSSSSSHVCPHPRHLWNHLFFYSFFTSRRRNRAVSTRSSSTAGDKLCANSTTNNNHDNKRPASYGRKKNKKAVKRWRRTASILSCLAKMVLAPQRQDNNSGNKNDNVLAIVFLMTTSIIMIFLNTIYYYYLIRSNSSSSVDGIDVTVSASLNGMDTYTYFPKTSSNDYNPTVSSSIVACRKIGEEYPQLQDPSNADPIKLFAGEIIRETCHEEDRTILVDQDRPTTATTTAATREHLFVELVIAYCKSDISWIRQDILDTVFDDYQEHRNTTIGITILSKCGRDLQDIPPDLREDPRISRLDMLQLRNVGGCDYGYAYFLNRFLSSNSMKQYEATVSTRGEAIASPMILLFVKDTPRDMAHFGLGDQGTYRSFSEMVDLASQGEFACGTKTLCTLSPYHDVPMLKSWTMDNYIRISSRSTSVEDILHQRYYQRQQRLRDQQHGLEKEIKNDFNINYYSNLQDFHRRGLQWEYPNKEVVLVCYGGTFAVNLSQIVKILNDPKMKSILLLVENALSRSPEPTIEEHFMERTWAAMLSNPLNAEYTQAIKTLQNGALPMNISTSISGALVSGDIEQTCNETDLFKLQRKGYRRKRAARKRRREMNPDFKILDKREIKKRNRNRKVSSEQLRNYRKNKLLRLAQLEFQKKQPNL